MITIKLGLSVYCLPGHDPIDTIYFAVSNNFKAVELWDSNLSPPSIELLRIIKLAGIDISLHAPPVNLGDSKNFEKNVELLSKSILTAESWGAKSIVLHGGIIQKEEKYESSLSFAISVVQQVVKELERTGIQLCVENTGYMNQELFQRYSQLLDFVNLFPKKSVSIAFDMSHAEITQGVQKGFEVFGDRIKHIHISDAKKGETTHHLPLGSGHVDFSILKKVHFDGLAILEVTPNEKWYQNLLLSKKYLIDKRIIFSQESISIEQKNGLVFEEYKEFFPDNAYLEEIKELAINKNGSNNIIIEGENYIVLSILKQEYFSKIDVVCIDPPYNTGMDWLTYSDHLYKDVNNSYIHSKWLSFMKNRILITYDLLSERGVLFVNIDENETATLLMLCQEIFGENNVDVLIWPKTDPRFDANRVEKPFRDVKIVHEYIFVCFKNREKIKLNQIMQPTFKDGRWVDVASTLKSIINGLGTTSSAKDEIGEIFGDRLFFQTPKPMRLIKELIRAASRPDSIILDFFAGSGTTGHATMDLNKEDGGKRKFILVNNNENDICRNITYERIKRVIDKENYEESLKFYRINIKS